MVTSNVIFTHNHLYGIKINSPNFPCLGRTKFVFQLLRHRKKYIYRSYQLLTVPDTDVYCSFLYRRSHPFPRQDNFLTLIHSSKKQHSDWRHALNHRTLTHTLIVSNALELSITHNTGITDLIELKEASCEVAVKCNDLFGR